MKKALSLILVLALCVSLAACGGTGNKDHDYILHLLEQGDYDMAIHVIEGLRDSRTGTGETTQATEPEGAGATESARDGQDPHHQQFDMLPEVNGEDWLFHMSPENLLEEEISLEALIIVDFLEGNELGGVQFVEGDLERIGLANVTLAPGETLQWMDGHPAATHFDQRLYQFIFRDGTGNQVDVSYYFHMEDMMPEESTPSMEQPTGDWFFPIVLENTGDSNWTLFAMDITDLKDGEPLGTSIFEGDENLSRIGLGGFVMHPGQVTNWNDAHPAVSDWNGREYRFHFRDVQGKTQTLTFRFEDLDKQGMPVDYSQDQGKDLKTLRYEADFRVEVSPGVYWVPAASLGGSRYSNSEIHGMLSASPEEKQERVSTLYEALQLYQVGNFTPSDDNVRIFENGINWEHHKPGYHAVRTNTGCCATDSNWLRYILDGDYEEVGFIATSQPDGSGHVYNYILHEGWYYIIDLTHYHASGSPIDTAVEDGDLAGYNATDFVLGNIHKVQDINDYVLYVQQTFHEPPGLMLQYTAENVLAVDSLRGDSGVQIVYEDAQGQPIRIIYDVPEDSLTFARAESPTKLPDWNTLP